jgi:integrase
LADNTVRRRCGIAKQFFRAAERKGLIAKNPFADLVAAVRANASRFHFISREIAERIIEACPSAEWRLLFALSRYGGLRCPSEHLSLRWSDVDWARGRITVRSPKTEHHQGKESRVIPLFPELRPHLEAAQADPRSSEDWVIVHHRTKNANLRTQFNRILDRAGVKAWPNLFKNLRSTRETELAREHPLHVVCEWLGNSQLVAAKHYLQVTDDDYKRAAATENDAAEAAQKATRNGQEPARTASQAKKSKRGKTQDFPTLASQCEAVQGCTVGATGLEPVTPAL